MSEPYTIMPIRFRRRSNEIFISGEAGDFQHMKLREFDDLLAYRLKESDKLYQDLESKNLIASDNLAQAINLTATRYRTRKSFLNDFTVLHMLVVTVRCNHKCEYCQASCEDEEAKAYDMSPANAEKAVEYALKSPSEDIKIEFQGGEPLLNWNAVTAAVIHAEKLNIAARKNISFVICTNLTLIDDEKLEFIKEHQILISTSLDGPEHLHDASRKMRLGGDGSHKLFLKKLDITRQSLGHDKVSALMTTSAYNLYNLPEVIDEYVRLGFNGIFIRPLNPYGFANEKKETLGYSVEDFVESYKKALEYIIKLNLSGIDFTEYYTTLLLSRMLTPFATGFVDLQSPSGAGISGVIYDYNGDIYPADEARMLSKMGDKRFLMGNVKDKYKEVFNGRILKEIVSKSCLEIMPVCADCAYLPYCGADPVRNYLETNDIVGKRPESPFCAKNLAIFDHLFGLIKCNNRKVMDVFWAWITHRSYGEIADAAN